MSALQFGLTPKMKPLPPNRSVLVAALDVGTSKIACLIGRLKPRPPQDVLRLRSHSIDVVGFGHTLARGMKSGGVIDLAEAEAAVRQCADLAERSAKMQLDAVVVSVSAGRPASELISASIEVAGSAIGDRDIARVLTAGSHHSVRAGLRRLSEAPNPGCAALLAVAGITAPVTAEHLAFQLGPRINAAGRMEDAMLALELLMAESREAADPLAQRLHDQNAQRQQLTLPRGIARHRDLDIVDSDSRRTKVRIAFPNPEIRLKPNMFATVSFFAPAQKVATVPATALVLKNDGERVFVEVAPWTFQPRNVEVNFEQGNSVVIKSGLTAGERAVVKGGVLLND